MTPPPSKRARSGSASSARSRTPTPEDDEQWTHGDFEIITSDNVRFLIPSYLLFGASPIFRDARKIATPADDGLVGSLTLLDPLIETAPVLRLFLGLVHTGIPASGYWMPHTHHLVPFLRKWACDVAFRHLLLWITEAAMNHSVSPMRAFAVLAAADDKFSATNVIRYCTFDTWGSDRPECEASDWETQGRDRLVPTRLPLYIYTDIPPAYAFALVRAYAAYPRALGQGTEPGADFADEFCRWLEIAQEARPTHEVLDDFPEREEPY